MKPNKDACALSDYDLEKRYDEFLDECFGEVSIGGLEYSTSNAMKSVDPTAYRCGFCDWLDSEVSNNDLIEHEDNYYEPSDCEEEEEEEG